jgi:hypothetical protein
VFFIENKTGDLRSADLSEGKVVLRKDPVVVTGHPSWEAVIFSQSCFPDNAFPPNTVLWYSNGVFSPEIKRYFQDQKHSMGHMPLTKWPQTECHVLPVSGIEVALFLSTTNTTVWIVGTPKVMAFTTNSSGAHEFHVHGGRYLVVKAGDQTGEFPSRVIDVVEWKDAPYQPGHQVTPEQYLHFYDDYEPVDGRKTPYYDLVFGSGPWSWPIKSELFGWSEVPYRNNTGCPDEPTDLIPIGPYLLEVTPDGYMIQMDSIQDEPLAQDLLREILWSDTGYVARVNTCGAHLVELGVLPELSALVCSYL